MNRKFQQEQICKIANELEVLAQIDGDIGRIAYQTLQEYEHQLEHTDFGSVELGRILDKYSDTLRQLHGERR